MREIWDKIGISASVICVIHCLFTPLIVVSLPFFGFAIPHGWFHTIIVVIVFPVAVWALWNGFLMHRLKRVLYMGAAGIALLLTAMVAGRHSENAEYAFMIAAGVVLASAHFVNLRACRLDHR